MPKGIHDLPLNYGQTYGHEMQFNMHAPPGVDGQKYIPWGKGFMIDLVNEASFNSIPHLTRRHELVDKTVIICTLSYGVQRVDIYPVVGEEEEAVISEYKIVGLYHDRVNWRWGLYDEETYDDLYTTWEHITTKKNTSTTETYAGVLVHKPPLEFGLVDWTNENGSVLLTYGYPGVYEFCLRYSGMRYNAGNDEIYHGGKILTRASCVYTLMAVAIYSDKLLVLGNANRTDEPLQYIMCAASMPDLYEERETPYVLDWEEIGRYIPEEIVVDGNTLYGQMLGWNFNAAGNQIATIQRFSGEWYNESEAEKVIGRTILGDVSIEPDGSLACSFEIRGKTSTGVHFWAEKIPGTIDVTLEIDDQGGGSGDCDEGGPYTGTTTIAAARGCGDGINPASSFDVTDDWNWSYCSGGGKWIRYKSTWTMNDNLVVYHREGSILGAVDYQFLTPEDDDYDPDNPKKQRLAYMETKYDSIKIARQRSEYIKYKTYSVGNTNPPDNPLTFRRNSKSIEQHVGEEGVYFTGIDEVAPEESGWIPNIIEPTAYKFPAGTQLSDYASPGVNGLKGWWFTVTKEDGDLWEDQEVILEEAGGGEAFWGYVIIHALDLRYKHVAFHYWAFWDRLDFSSSHPPEIGNPDCPYHYVSGTCTGYPRSVKAEAGVDAGCCVTTKNRETKLVFFEHFIEPNAGLLGLPNCTNDIALVELNRYFGTGDTVFYYDRNASLSSGACYIQMFIWDYSGTVDQKMYMQLFTANGTEIDLFEVTPEFAQYNVPLENTFENDIHLKPVGII